MSAISEKKVKSIAAAFRILFQILDVSVKNISV
jgi:hypothetical protein